jgi:hypothetical protein
LRSWCVYSLKKAIFFPVVFLYCFVTTGSVENGKSSGRSKVIEDVVENIRDYLEEHSRTSLTTLFLQSGVPGSTCHKIVKKNLLLHP